jgi:hypothetical protein
MYASGWTPDGRALDDITSALGLAERIWPYVSPCSAFAAYVMAAGGGDAATVAFLAEHGFSCKEFAVGANMQLRVAALDFTALVLSGKIPIDKLRLPSEVAHLPYLEQLRAEGYPLQSSEQTVDPMAEERQHAVL